ncbi:MAG: hypothetical protein AAF621_08620 [Pseudomonadota bacterium]
MLSNLPEKSGSAFHPEKYAFAMLVGLFLFLILTNTSFFAQHARNMYLHDPVTFIFSELSLNLSFSAYQTLTKLTLSIGILSHIFMILFLDGFKVRTPLTLCGISIVAMLFFQDHIYLISLGEILSIFLGLFTLLLYVSRTTYIYLIVASMLFFIAALLSPTIGIGLCAMIISISAYHSTLEGSKDYKSLEYVLVTISFFIISIASNIIFFGYDIKNMLLLKNYATSLIAPCIILIYLAVHKALEKLIIPENMAFALSLLVVSGGMIFTGHLSYSYIS